MSTRTNRKSSKKEMAARSVTPLNLLVREQAAKALLRATYAFLRSNKIAAGSQRWEDLSKDNESKKLTLYRKAMRTYESMGVLMATWFTNPTFLDSFGNPISLTASKGPRSIVNLIRLSKVQVSSDIAIELLKNSPSVKSVGTDHFVALRRVFVLPEFEIPRAALVVERYLNTLRHNAQGRKRGATLLLERSCHVPQIDLRTVGPILRDIKERGTAFMDSTDGEIESSRLRRSRRSKKAVTGEVGVVVFAWTKSKGRQV
jgi:hypothetical protein